MSRSTEQKRIHYVRAAYSPGAAPTKSFQALIDDALKALPKQKDTDVCLPTTEVLSVRHRSVANGQPTNIAIGLGVPNEAMSTLGVGQDLAADTEKASKPPHGRAFKLADAFCLIDENDLLVCMDGSIRINKVEGYLRGLLKQAGMSPEIQSFELVARINQDKAKTLDAEGVKAFEVKGTAYAASASLDGAHPNQFESAWQGIKAAIRNVFENEVSSAEERQQLASHWGEVNVTTVFSVDGGMRGEPLVIQSLEGAAKEIQNQAPPGAEVTLITGKGNRIGVSVLTLKTLKGIKRIAGQNALDYTDAWAKLSEYRQELVDSKRWKN